MRYSLLIHKGNFGKILFVDNCKMKKKIKNVNHDLKTNLINFPLINLI